MKYANQVHSNVFTAGRANLDFLARNSTHRYSFTICCFIISILHLVRKSASLSCFRETSPPKNRMLICLLQSHSEGVGTVQ